MKLCGTKVVHSGELFDFLVCQVSVVHKPPEGPTGSSHCHPWPRPLQGQEVRDIQETDGWSGGRGGGVVETIL